MKHQVLKYFTACLHSEAIQAQASKGPCSEKLEATWSQNQAPAGEPNSPLLSGPGLLELPEVEESPSSLGRADKGRQTRSKAAVRPATCTVRPKREGKTELSAVLSAEVLGPALLPVSLFQSPRAM